MLAFFTRLRLLPSIEHARETDALVRQLDHPAHDCLYAAVARRIGAALITCDERFAAKLRGARIHVPVAVVG